MPKSAVRVRFLPEGSKPDAHVIGPNGDVVATVTHEGISYTVRMVTPYPAATSRGFAQVRGIEAWVRGQMRRVGR